MNEEEIRADERRRIAERVLLVSELARGHRCPKCHGKPAADRWKSGRRRRYRCGCGHQWDAANTTAEYEAAMQSSPSALLRRIAQTGELPEQPAKEGR